MPEPLQVGPGTAGGRGDVSVDSSEILVEGPWRHRLVPANGGRFHVAEQGEGPLVLLLHGFPQFWWAWRHQLQGLADAGYHAAAMDLRGYGASDKPPRGYDTASLCADVAGVIRGLGKPSAVVVGHDWGGWLAWSMPGYAPRVTRAVAVLSTPHPLQVRSAMLRGRLGPGRAELLALQLPMLPERRLIGGDAVARALRANGGPGYPDAESLCRYTRAMQVPFVAHTSVEYFRWALRSVPRADGRRFARVARRPVTVPVLHLRGSADPWFPQDRPWQPPAWVVGGFEQHVVPLAGHYLPEEAADDVTAHLRGWLQDLPPQ